MLKNKWVRQIGAVVLIAILYLGNQVLEGTSGTDVGVATPAINQSGPDDTQRIISSFNAKRSDVWVQAPGRIAKILPDDNKGSRHQKFVVELSTGHTILIAHNIDLAPRIPLQRGDPIEFRGEYEWNEKGGVVHWTHHDPSGRKKGGWISHQSRTYE